MVDPDSLGVTGGEKGGDAQGKNTGSFTLSIEV
jgi:hypothetical protein